MYSWNLEKERCEAESYLSEKRTDFVTTYMTVSNLQFIIRQNTEIISESTITALLCVLKGDEHATQRQVYFLYRKAANALAAIFDKTDNRQLADQAGKSLIHILYATREKPFRAAAEALGSLPLKIKGPQPAADKSQSFFPTVSWQTLLLKNDFPADALTEWKGRNLVIYSGCRHRVLVLKLLRSGEDPAMLHEEGRWMRFLADHKSNFSLADDWFHIPSPIAISNSYIFRVENIGIEIPENKGLDSRLTAIGFITRPDYFCYPNEHPPAGLLDPKTFLEIMGKNAFLLGRLASGGIIHTAPIPLFHNRVQRHRRDDQGLYQWPRGGRLDRWLDSCRYPNIGRTGIRDFEHMIPFNGSARKLYELIGSHVFSLVLIVGSYFRNRNIERMGFDENGKPVDARDLFDKTLLKKAVKTIFTNYYRGFTENAFQGSLPLDADAFTARLIDEMGVDQHMEEILRVAEQNAMSETEFFYFLASRGISEYEMQKLKKGNADITILTGPHLGGFNQPISLPELIEFTAATAALCIADRYCHQKLLNR